MAPNRRAVAVPLSTGAVPPAAAVAARAQRRRVRPMQAAPLRAGAAAAGAAVLASPLPIEGALPPLYPAALPAVTTAAVIPAMHAAPAPPYRRNGCGATPAHLRLLRRARRQWRLQLQLRRLGGGGASVTLDVRRRMVRRRWLQRAVQVGWRTPKRVCRRVWVRHQRRLERVQAQLCVLMQVRVWVLRRRLRRPVERRRHTWRRRLRRGAIQTRM